MGKIERRAHLNRATNLEFMEHIRKKAPKDSDSFPKKIVMDWSFVCQNIIPGWHLEGRDPERRGWFKLSLLEEAFKKVEAEALLKAQKQADARAQREADLKKRRAEKAAPKPKKKREPKKHEDLGTETRVLKVNACPICHEQREMTQRTDPETNEFVTEIRCGKCGIGASIRTMNKKAGQELAEIEFLDSPGPIGAIG